MGTSDATVRGSEARDASPPTGIVLVHGACSHSGCWAPTVAAIAARAPDVAVVAVDLPGRGRSRVPLAGVTVEACVDEAVRQIEDANVVDVVLVGHSLAGVIVPGMATRLGSERVQRLVFLSCSVPPEGGRVVDVLRGPLKAIATLAARRRSPTRLPAFVALAAFANGMDQEQRHIVSGTLCPEAGWLIAEAVTRQGFDHTIPRTWVLTRRDRGLSPLQQRRSIENLGGVDECVELDAPHDAMVSHPEALADILVARVRRAAEQAVTT
jgi:pimeloyl-ACP methyl ester carboxylesterase